MRRSVHFEILSIETAEKASFMSEVAEAAQNFIPPAVPATPQPRTVP